MQDFVGQQIDRYRITERLGMGGMAVVYKAYDTNLERDVALKMIRIGAIPPDQYDRLRQRFILEAHAMAKLNHPNIVPIYDYGEFQGTPYLVMAFIEGGTLKDFIGQPMGYHKAAAVLAPIADALGYAHQRAILHRDVKPANILITEAGTSMLSDFGIAKLLEGTDPTLTGDMGVGTPQYMAPEQWDNDVCPQTDVYALGVVLYELVTGQKPYNADTPAAMAVLQATEPLKRPKVFVPDLPERVEKVIFKALAMNPEDRYPTMDVFASRLKALAQGVEHVVSPQFSDRVQADSEGETVDQGEGAGSSHSPAAGENEKKSKLPTWLIPLAVAVSLVVCVGLVFGVSRLPFIRSMLNFSDEPVLESLSPEELSDTSEMLESRTAEPIRAVESTQEAVQPQPGNTPTQPPAEPTADEIPPTQTMTLQPTLGIGVSTIRQKDGMEMMYVPSGTFLMGADESDPNAFAHEKPQHEVFLDAFWMDAYEVSNAMFSQFVVETGHETRAEKNGFSYMYDTNWNWVEMPDINWQYPFSASTAAQADLPVVHVDYYDAQAYCTWAGGRLPTEAEWEKAASGEDGSTYPWGNVFDPNVLCFDNNNGPVSVFAFPDGRSPYGIYNMAGNVFEWTQDWYSASYYRVSSRENPSGPNSGDWKVLRGGSWNNSQKNLRVTHRDYSPLDLMSYLSGFRCVMD